MINIVGLGYGDIDDLTVKVFKLLKESNNIYIKDNKHQVVEELIKQGVKFKNYIELIDMISQQKGLPHDVIYAVSGNPDECDEVIRACKKNKEKYKVYEACGVLEFIERCVDEKVEKVDVISAHNMQSMCISRQNGVVITHLRDEKTARNIKTKLSRLYNKETYIYHIKIGDSDVKDKVRIKNINEIKEWDEQSLLYIPKSLEGKKNINDLAQIIEILRGENGCPWDKEQSHESIKKDIVEESYEVFDAIEKKDNDAIIEELGDVLFQVMFHASIGEENNEFTMLDITDGISNKMIYRHPHVFGDLEVENTAEVLVNWDELKKDEKNFRSLTDELNGIAKALPALIRADKVQKKAKKIGFDWDDVSYAFEKVKEELNEVMDVYKSEKLVRIKEEIGDLLFSCVNVSRFLKIDPEEALNITTEKFIRRLSYIEDKSKEMNLDLEKMSLSDMDELWNEAKKLENK